MTLRLFAAIAALTMTLGLAACGGTPDAEDKPLADAKKQLADADVKSTNITIQPVPGVSGTPNDSWYVCDHDPDGVDPETPTTLEVAPTEADCPADTSSDSDSSKKKRKKK
jgi:hypothetical protein